MDLQSSPFSFVKRKKASSEILPGLGAIKRFDNMAPIQRNGLPMYAKIGKR
jgi:hypothetical protein